MAQACAASLCALEGRWEFLFVQPLSVILSAASCLTKLFKWGDFSRPGTHTLQQIKGPTVAGYMGMPVAFLKRTETEWLCTSRHEPSLAFSSMPPHGLARIPCPHEGPARIEGGKAWLCLHSALCIHNELYWQNSTFASMRRALYLGPRETTHQG